MNTHSIVWQTKCIKIQRHVVQLERHVQPYVQSTGRLNVTFNLTFNILLLVILVSTYVAFNMVNFAPNTSIVPVHGRLATAAGLAQARPHPLHPIVV